MSFLLPPFDPPVTLYIPLRPPNDSFRNRQNDKGRINFNLTRHRRAFGKWAVAPWKTDRAWFDPNELEVALRSHSGGQSGRCQEQGATLSAAADETKSAYESQKATILAEREAARQRAIKKAKFEREKTLAYQRLKGGIATSVPEKYRDVYWDQMMDKEKQDARLQRIFSTKRQQDAYRTVTFSAEPLHQLKQKFMRVQGKMAQSMLEHRGGALAEDFIPGKELTEVVCDTKQTKTGKAPSSEKRSDAGLEVLGCNIFARSFCDYVRETGGLVQKSKVRANAQQVAELQKQKAATALFDRYYASLASDKEDALFQQRAQPSRVQMETLVRSSKQPALHGLLTTTRRKNPPVRLVGAKRPQTAR